MASVKCLVPVDAFRNKYNTDSASGTRAIFILGSTASLPSEEVVPRRAVTLTDDDTRVLSSLGLPPDRWTDQDVIVARHKLDDRVSIGPQEIFRDSNELSCDYVLKKLGDFMRSSVDKDGAIIHYFGNGRKFKGDWCFSDGYVSFEDLMDVYMENYRGHVLTIVTDCSYSGHWVRQCYEFLDGQGIGPCGHCAILKGVLLKVYASCTPSETAGVLGYSLKCMFIDKNTGDSLHRVQWKIAEKQHSFGRDFTRMLCGKKADEQCALDDTETWETVMEADRVYLVKGDDKGRPAWYYVLLVDDEDTIAGFKDALKNKVINLENYGQILHSGFGKEPPNEVTDRVQKKYHIKK